MIIELTKSHIQSWIAIDLLKDDKYNLIGPFDLLWRAKDIMRAAQSAVILDDLKDK
jgi:hypothetical protein